MPTEEEVRAEAYRMQRAPREQFREFLASKLTPSAEQRRLVAKAWKPLLPGESGDTSYPRRSEEV